MHPEPTAGQLLIDEPAPGVARLIISNPDKRGALDHAILDRLAAAMPELDARCVLITGQDRIFSAGYDIGDLDGWASGMFADEAEKLVAHPFAAAIDAIDACPFPTLAALNGHTIGGGLELALSCDLRIAAQPIKLGMPPAKLGLVYSHTGIRKFIDAIGAPRTRELFLIGGQVDADTAHLWGTCQLGRGARSATRGCPGTGRRAGRQRPAGPARQQAGHPGGAGRRGLAGADGGARAARAAPGVFLLRGLP